MNELQDKYFSIVGEVSEINTKLNSLSVLSDQKELAELFVTAESTIQSLITKKPNRFLGGLRTFVEDTGWAKKIETSNLLAKSVQGTIDQLFAVVDTKYGELLSAGEVLQESKKQLESQIQELRELQKLSSSTLSEYINQEDIPMRELMLDTNIKASAEKYTERLNKINATILTAQATLISLGKDLPSLKTDLVDEMALGNLLNILQDAQTMYSTTVDLIGNVADTVSEKTHTVVEELMDIQINDTHTATYIAKAIERGEKTAKMVVEKSNLLANKAVRDAKFISEIVNGSSVIEARKAVKLLK